MYVWYNLIGSFLEMYLEKLSYIHTKFHTSMFIAALLVIAKNNGK